MKRVKIFFVEKSSRKNKCIIDWGEKIVNNTERAKEAELTTVLDHVLNNKEIRRRFVEQWTLLRQNE